MGERKVKMYNNKDTVTLEKTFRVFLTRDKLAERVLARPCNHVFDQLAYFTN